MTENGVLKNKSQLLKELKPLPTGYIGRINVTEPRIIRHNETYILSFIADEYLSLYGQTIHTAYAEMDTYIKDNRDWLLLASELFELAADPAIVNLSSEFLKRYEGVYELAEGVEYKVFLDEGKLFGQWFGKPLGQLMPETESVFFVRGERGRKLFIKDGNGQIQLIDRRNGHDLIWKRK